MYNVIFYLSCLLILGILLFAIYGFNRFGEKREGLYINDEAEEILDDLWVYSQKKFFLHLFKEKETEAARREMKPCIIAVALKVAEKQLETKGQDCKVYELMENEARIIVEGNAKLRVR